MSTALKLLAGVVLASIFLGIFVGLKTKFDRSSELAEFREGAQNVATMIEGLGSQIPGAQAPYRITVPKDCKLRFEDEEVVAVIGGGSYTYPTGVKTVGPTLRRGSHDLLFKRTENGVEVD